MLAFTSTIIANFFDTVSSWCISGTSTPSSSGYIFTPMIIECRPILSFKPFSISLTNDFTTHNHQSSLEYYILNTVPWVCESINLSRSRKVRICVPRIIMHSSISEPSKLSCKRGHKTAIMISHQIPGLVSSRVCFSHREKCPTVITTGRFTIDAEVVTIKVFTYDSNEVTHALWVLRYES